MTAESGSAHAEANASEDRQSSDQRRSAETRAEQQVSQPRLLDGDIVGEDQNPERIMSDCRKLQNGGMLTGPRFSSAGSLGLLVRSVPDYIHITPCGGVETAPSPATAGRTPTAASDRREPGRERSVAAEMLRSGGESSGQSGQRNLPVRRHQPVCREDTEELPGGSFQNKLY